MKETQVKKSYVSQGLPGGASVKKLPANVDVRDVGSVPGLGRSPGGWHHNPLQCSCLENLMDRGTWQAMVHRVTQGWTRLKQLSTHAGKLKEHNGTGHEVSRWKDFLPPFCHNPAWARELGCCVLHPLDLAMRSGAPWTSR